jgi:two-component system, OmpR family, sensor histidine kinase KdpD
VASSGFNGARQSRRDPDVLLRQLEAAAAAERRAQLKIFLGYAKGVGKSFRLIDEARRRRDRGEDVVVVALQPVLSAEATAALAGLEIIPPTTRAGVPVIDVPAVLARRPAVAVVDGLAYDNPPGSRRAKRYLDVEDLLGAGISVLTSINLEFIAEEQAFVASVGGRTRTDVVPRALIDRADEVIVVDAPPDATASAEAHALRRRALLLVADVVDRQLEEYLALNGIQMSWGTQERVLVCMTPRANAAALLASGRRNADRFHGQLFAVYVAQPHLTVEDRMALHRNVSLARAQGAEVEMLEGKDPIATILDYARSRNVTQIFVGHNIRSGWRNRLGGTPLDRLIRDAEGFDVRVFPH